MAFFIITALETSGLTEYTYFPKTALSNTNPAVTQLSRRWFLSAEILFQFWVIPCEIHSEASDFPASFTFFGVR
jgi:hypothetical protein